MSNTETISRGQDDGLYTQLYVTYIFGNKESNFGGQVIDYPINEKRNPDKIKELLLKVDPELSSWFTLEVLAWSEIR